MTGPRLAQLFASAALLVIALVCSSCGASDDKPISVDTGGDGGALDSGAPGSTGGDDAGSSPQGDDTDGGEVPIDSRALPFVMIVADSSGSMERLRDCTCSTTSCDECLPDCKAGERSAFIDQLEALTGTFAPGNCSALERTRANGATFDEDYAIPYHQPPSAGQAKDGLLDTYATKLRFGAAVFDGVETYVGSSPLVSEAGFDRARARGRDGLWSFAGTNSSNKARIRSDNSVVGRLSFPGAKEIFAIDTGLRNELADNGALLASFSSDISATIQDSLLATRPFGSSPVAAALDDLDYFFRSNSEAQASSGRRYVVLLTGDVFDDDFRSYRCDCTDDPKDDNYCGDGQPFEEMACPYPLATDAAHKLVTKDRVDEVYVVGFVTKKARASLDAVAKAGGSDSARAATSAADLRTKLAAIFDEILAR